MTPTYYDRESKTVKAVVRQMYLNDLAYEDYLASLPAPIPIAPGTEQEFEQMPNPIFEGVHYEVRYKLLIWLNGENTWATIDKELWEGHPIEKHKRIIAFPLPQQEKQEDLWRDVVDIVEKGTHAPLAKVIEELSKKYKLTPSPEQS